jgi:hypothetical protein
MRHKIGRRYRECFGARRLKRGQGKCVSDRKGRKNRTIKSMRYRLLIALTVLLAKRFRCCHRIVAIAFMHRRDLYFVAGTRKHGQTPRGMMRNRPLREKHAEESKASSKESGTAGSHTAYDTRLLQLVPIRLGERYATIQP